MFISVIVPVRNEAKFIERTLSQLVTQDYDSQRFEVLVVDGQSTDGTPDLVAQIAAQHQNVRLFSNPRRLSSAARNFAIREARGDVVVIVDGHCEIEDDQYMSKLAAASDGSGAGVELNHGIERAGLRCYFTPQVAVHYAPRTNLGGLFRQLVRYGRGRLWRKHPETFSFGIVPPLVLVVGLILGLLLSLADGWLAAVYTGALVLYVAVVLAGSAPIALRHRNPQSLGWLPLVFEPGHLGSGRRLLRGLFRAI